MGAAIFAAMLPWCVPRPCQTGVPANCNSIDAPAGAVVSATVIRKPTGVEGMNTITWQDFEKVELRAGTIVAAEPFPEARKPAYQLTVDFGPEAGIRKSSVQITVHYKLEELIGQQVLGVVNFPPKRIGPFLSECLVCGFYREDGSVVLAVPDKPVPNGAKLG